MSAEQSDDYYSEIEDLARQWPDEYLSCRTYGHLWQPYRASHNTRLRYWRSVRICPRCNTEKTEEISERGMILASWYTYPDGYQTKGLGYIGGEARGAIRLQALTRTFEQEKLTAKQAREDIPRSRRTRREIGLEP